MQLGPDREQEVFNSNAAGTGLTFPAAYARSLTAWLNAGAGVTAFTVLIEGALADDATNWAPLLTLAFGDDAQAAPKWQTKTVTGRFKYVRARATTVTGGNVTVWLMADRQT